MSESAKTLVYIAIAVVTLGLSFVLRPVPAVTDVNDEIGQMLTLAFEPELAKRLTIVKFDEETATLSEFEVAEQDGVWVIPSKGGYPADAVRQMAEATTGVTDREILSIAGVSAADHEQYGVVDPRSPKLEVGQTGVGLRVTLADEDNGPLADVIIGKEVKDQPNQRYIRRQSQDVVYVVEIDPEKFSTDFDDWIEDDLLKITPSNMQRVQIKDYTAELIFDRGMPEMRWQRRGESTLVYNSADSKWEAEDLKTYDKEGEQFVSAPLAENEALDDDILRDFKSALDDLRIVDVESKPSSLSANLKASKDFLDDADAVGSLVRRGFAPVRTSAEDFEILSSEGEVICTMKDGVEYVLRFGNVESSGNSADTPGDEKEGDEDNGVNRYLFVVARFNDAVIDKPELEALPEESVESETDSQEAEAAEDESEDEEPVAESDASTDGEEEADKPKESDREAVERRNKAKQEAYDAEIAAGKKRVDELNARFGDWYYVVANSVYSKIRLGRDDFVKAAETSGEDTDAENASVLGAPGAPVPGLPNIGGLGVDADESAPGEEASADQAETATE